MLEMTWCRLYSKNCMVSVILKPQTNWHKLQCALLIICSGCHGQSPLPSGLSKKSHSLYKHYKNDWFLNWWCAIITGVLNIVWWLYISVLIIYKWCLFNSNMVSLGFSSFTAYLCIKKGSACILEHLPCSENLTPVHVCVCVCVHICRPVWFVIVVIIISLRPL